MKSEDMPFIVGKLYKIIPTKFGHFPYPIITYADRSDYHVTNQDNIVILILSLVEKMLVVRSGVSKTGPKEMLYDIKFVTPDGKLARVEVFEDELELIKNDIGL